MKINILNYIRPKKIRTLAQAQALREGVFPLSKLGYRQKFTMKADLFEAAMNNTQLPKNAIIKVKGDVSQFTKLFGGDNTTLKVKRFLNHLEVKGPMGIKSQNVKHHLSAVDNPTLNIGTIEGSAFLSNGVNLEANKINGLLLLDDHAQAYVDKLLKGAELRGQAHLWANNVQGDLKFFSNKAKAFFIKQAEGKVLNAQPKQAEKVTTVATTFDKLQIL